MSSGMYVSGLAALMGGDVDLVNDSISVLLVDLNFYTPNLSLDNTQADIPEDAYIAEARILGKAIDVTTFRGDDTTFNAVESEKIVSAVVVFKDTGVYSTSTLLCFIDNAPQFPITPDGTDIVINWNTGANGIFKL